MLRDWWARTRTEIERPALDLGTDSPVTQID